MFHLIIIIVITQEKINHLILMDDIKLLAKNEKEWETLKQAEGIYSQDIEADPKAPFSIATTPRCRGGALLHSLGMEFCTKNCVMLIMKSGKRQMTKEMQILNQQKKKKKKKKNVDTWEYWKQTPSNKRR